MSVMDRRAPAADLRIPYGPGALQFGDLWLPRSGAAGGGAAGWPVLVFVHGGWWRSAFDLGYGGHLAAAMRALGVAVWSIEYRRVGDAGGGWPGSFQDVAAGVDHVQAMALEHRLDLGRVVAAGHSAGGQMAFWAAGRRHVPEGSPLREPQPRVRLRGLVGLAAAVDLRLTIELAGSGLFAHDAREVERLMGGGPAAVPERYRAGNPGDLLPLNTPQMLLQGTVDGQIPPELPGRWAQMAGAHGDTVAVTMIPEADHFDVVDPESRAWPTVRAAILRML